MLIRSFKWGQPLLVLLLWVGIQIPQTKEGTNPNIIIAQNNVSKSICPNELGTKIEEIIQRREFMRSHWGILIQPLNSNFNLYAKNSEKFFIPASNIKLLTTAAALLEFGSQFFIRTPIYRVGHPPNLTTLRLVGQGDPTITTDTLKALAKQLKQQGIQKIEKLIIQEGYFNNSGIPPMWEWDDLFFSYGVPANTFVLNENTFDLILTPTQVGQQLQLSWTDSIAAKQWQFENLTTTTDSTTDNNISIQGFFAQSRLIIRGQLGNNVTPNTEKIAIIAPNKYFLDTLAEVLENEGISVAQKQIISGNDSNRLENEIAFIISPSLELLIQKVNHESHNLYAETLLKLLENKANDEPKTSILQKQLTQLGIDENSYKIVDGSGLSRHNLATPDTFVTLLQNISQTPQGKVYRNSLAVGGINGTLANRFKNTPIQGNLQGKTGSLSGISALSGYLDIPNGETLVFSIMINTSDQPNTNLRQGIDEIILLLSQLKKCSNNNSSLL
ncbi:D-alanyl-D-alanine carboxypeptidase/D-alanyl-D-alanine-endopeptidase [Aphanothece hegewaldii CCALA 016]|uniref:D-alanyl-D-alanine carboxypeptidase/D-alanyl-D-alanine-endopeptidase n=1 Tax=Aphanothece hegewaldii CCALA 016 TaxID=2107694 RepID=A0A2T1M0E5_9CHRO|nr:D-alanyl-D-alanine carboxypeptidase/D-alanyl-D-alanine-endopeptidase [Aphanothece hegewaldii]PSF38140.1 D-alanyl-D-alanine carboxypeptidase/D-alanyl-D-alanine-endopeptidase [Aphanothece hegewaldii CCALA 016]